MAPPAASPGRPGPLARFVGWLRRRGWGPHQAIAASLAGIGAGVYTIAAAADSSGLDRVVAGVVGIVCLAGGLAFFLALVVMNNDRPRSSKRKIAPGTTTAWPTRRGGRHRDDQS
jgi:hypothetical protein